MVNKSYSLQVNRIKRLNNCKQLCRHPYSRDRAGKEEEKEDSYAIFIGTL